MKKLIDRLIAKFDQGCAHATQISSVSLDRRLSLKEHIELYRHFLICDFCRRYHSQLDTIQKLSATFGRDETNSEIKSSQLDDEARERIKRALNSHQNE